jgi:cell wall-associated NlpC family hydrolase
MTLTQEQRAAVVAEARTWLRTPWHHRARVKGAGVDCGMFPLEVFERCGLIPHFEPNPYPHDFHMHRGEERYLAVVERYCDPTAVAQPGDIALFRWGKCISHGSIVIEWPVIIHSYVDVGSVVLDSVEHNLALAKRFVGVYAFRGTK